MLKEGIDTSPCYGHSKLGEVHGQKEKGGHREEETDSPVRSHPPKGGGHGERTRLHFVDRTDLPGKHTKWKVPLEPTQAPALGIDMGSGRFQAFHLTLGPLGINYF